MQLKKERNQFNWKSIKIIYPIKNPLLPHNTFRPLCVRIHKYSLCPNGNEIEPICRRRPSTVHFSKLGCGRRTTICFLIKLINRKRNSHVSCEYASGMSTFQLLPALPNCRSTISDGYLNINVLSFESRPTTSTTSDFRSIGDWRLPDVSNAYSFAHSSGPWSASRSGDGKRLAIGIQFLKEEKLDLIHWLIKRKIIALREQISEHKKPNRNSCRVRRVWREEENWTPKWWWSASYKVVTNFFLLLIDNCVSSRHLPWRKRVTAEQHKGADRNSIKRQSNVAFLVPKPHDYSARGCRRCLQILWHCVFFFLVTIYFWLLKVFLLPNSILKQDSMIVKRGLTCNEAFFQHFATLRISWDIFSILSNCFTHRKFRSDQFCHPVR